MDRRSVGLIVSAMFLLYGLKAYSNTTALTIDSSQMSLGKYLSYIEDANSSLKLEDFLSKNSQSILVRSESDTLNFGYSSSTFWFQLEVTSPVKKDFLLQMNWPQLDYLDIYTLYDGQITSHFELGDNKPFNQRVIQHRYFIVPISIEPYKNTKIVIKVKTKNVVRVNPVIYEPYRFIQDDTKITLINGLYFGCMLVMLIYNSFISFTLRSKAYLFYVIFISNHVLAFLYLTGYSYQYLWPDNPIMHEKSLPVCIGFLIWASSEFTYYFLNLKPALPRLHHVVRLTSGLGLVIGISSIIFGVYLPFQFLNSLVIWPSLFLIYVACIMLKKGSIEARYYLIALVFFVVSVLFMTLSANGLMPEFLITRFLAQIGSAIMVVLFAIALANRIKRLQNENIDIQKEAAESLQQKVQERTVELLAAKEDSDVAKRSADAARREAVENGRIAESLKQKAEAQTEQLKELDKAKTAFFQNISHELRTPLTLIMNPLENAVRRYTEDKNVAIAAKNSKRLLRLVNQLLDFQKLEAGKKELILSPINLTDFIQHCGDYFSTACKSRDIIFNLRCKDDLLDDNSLDFWCMAEIDALEKIVFNYLSNALKYTPNGGSIELGLKIKSNKIRIYVVDSGAGISEKDQQKLFRVFSQVDTSTTRSQEGTGLGLALVKSLTEEMKGTVGVESILGKGCCFWVEFDRLIVAQSEVYFLVVEDDEKLRDSIVLAILDHLDLKETEVCGKSSVEETLIFLRDHKVGCLISDYNLNADLDGFDLMKKVSQLYPETYRVMMSAEASFEMIEQAVNQNLVHHFLEKTNLPEFFLRIQEIVGNFGVISRNSFQLAKPLIDILIVEDDDEVRDAICHLVEENTDISRNKILLASSVEEGEDFLSSHIIRCVLTDYKLGGKDGLSLLQTITDEYPKVKRVLMTGHANFSVIQKAVNQGMVDQVFYKPLDWDQLISTLVHLVRESPVEQVVATEQKFDIKPWMLIAEEPEDPIDLEVLQDQSDLKEGEYELVLVVDDLADMRELIGADLIRKNYRVITANNGRVGLEQAREHHPDLIITDWMMPEMDGIALIKGLKSDPTLASIPSILLTAKSDEESKLMGTEMGADAFLGKPFSEKELISIVKNLLSLKAREKEVESLNLQLTENVLKRYLPPVLVDQIVSGETKIEQEPRGVNATVVFSDLVGFTQLSENLGTKMIAAVLNEYLEVMNQIIFEHDGVIDKFVGDSIMIIWGAPKAMDPEEQVRKAAQCAGAMQDAMIDLNTRWSQDNIPELKMRIGIHNGYIIVGNFGSKIRSDYTAIGPVVNFASRIEGKCEPGCVYFSEEVYQLLPRNLTDIAGDFNIKGIVGRRRLYKLAS